MATTDMLKARQRAAVMVAMLVGPNQQLDSARIAEEAGKLLGGKLRRGCIGGLLNGLENAGLASRGCFAGFDRKLDNRDRRQLTDAGRYAAEIMRGLLDQDGND